MSFPANQKAYKAFGLNIVSPIFFPELLQTDETRLRTDVMIEKADLTHQWNQSAAQQSRFVVKENVIMFRVPGTAIFSVEDGRRIAFTPAEHFDLDKIRLYILGTCMGALLMQRKILPLHGSAVAIDGKAYAFVGDRGAGKSTLAAAFLKNGCPLLSDDVVAVTFDDQSMPKVVPSYPQQKLWEESLRGFEMDSHHYRPLFDRETKYAIPVHEQFSTESFPLGGVIELAKSGEDETIIRRVEGLDRLYSLYRHTYRRFLIARSGLADWHFQFTTKAVSHFDYMRIQRSAEGFTAYDLVSRILSFINEEESVHESKPKAFVG